MKNPSAATHPARMWMVRVCTTVMRGKKFACIQPFVTEKVEYPSTSSSGSRGCLAPQLAA
jgi:hypothetical protein